MLAWTNQFKTKNIIITIIIQNICLDLQGHTYTGTEKITQ